MNRINFLKTYYKTKLFVSLALFVFASGILYSQTSANLDDSFTNLPNSKRLANNISIRAIGEDSLYVEWQGIYHPNLTYYVYRSNNPILSRPLLTTATVIGSVKATNNANSYSMLDILPRYGTYYYAVISYVDNIGFYTADSDVDTVSFEFKDPNAINTNIIVTNNTTMVIGTNNLLPITNEIMTNIFAITNYYSQTNYYTNYYNQTNYYNTTEIYIKPETNDNYVSNNPIRNRNTNDLDYIYTNENINGVVNTNSIKETIDNIMENQTPAQTEYDMYMQEYNKALAQFKLGNYSTAITLLEPVSKKNVNRNLYYNINLLLGKSYKNTNQKQNALNVFRRIQSINSAEVNFWVNQVLSDL